MKKKAWIWIFVGIFLLAVLFIPIPSGAYKDGGTRVYSALTYKIVDWNRLTEEGIYESTKVYWFPNSLQSIDELWTEEEKLALPKEEPVNEQPTMGATEIFRADASAWSAWIEITEIQPDYFIGTTGLSYPLEPEATTESPEDLPFWDPAFYTYEIKLNGQISEEWCVGDSVLCTFENGSYDPESKRYEADLLTIKSAYADLIDQDFEDVVCYKPVIYLYPEAEAEVSVQLHLDGALTCTYPTYNDGWNVTAAPDGTLTDEKGQIYNYLYWEGTANTAWDLSEGFCIRGEDTAAFLENALAKLGLNRREANEFIVYWLPMMEINPYNIISFQTDAYTNAAPLEISPAPDTLIRVFMTWQATDSFVEIPGQELTAPTRTGFTVIEWGGTEVID